MDEQTIRQIVAGVLAQCAGSGQLGGTQRRPNEVPVEVSARHVHLSQGDVERLFGPGYQLTPKRDLSQPGQFLCEERVSLVTAKGELRNVAILGPTRSQTQVELSQTDCRTLGIKAPVRLSGNLAGAQDVHIFSPKGAIQAVGSVIIAQNHIHMTPADAQFYGVQDGQKVRVRMETGRPITFEDVLIRVSASAGLAMHIDFDEANACCFGGKEPGLLLKD